MPGSRKKENSHFGGAVADDGMRTWIHGHGEAIVMQIYR